MARKPPAKPRAPTPSPPKPQPPEADPDPLVGEIEERLAPYLPANKREQVAQVMVSVFQESFSGPIAHPKHLAEYEAIHPGAAERIIRMAERAQEHHNTMQITGLNAAIADERRGMWIGGFILLLLVCGAFVSATYFNNNVGAGLLLGAAVLDAVALFLNRSKNE